MKNIGIHEPCSENWNAMTPTEKGAFCQKCAANVYDFTQKSNEEIKQTLRLLIGQPVCGKITPSQEAALNAEFDAYTFKSQRSFQSALVFSLIVVFGLTLFSCSNEQDRKQIKEIQATAIQAVKQVEEIPQLAVEPAVPKSVVEAWPDSEYTVVGYATELVPLEKSPDLIYQTYENPHYLGGMEMSRAYITYLESPVAPVVEELDANGKPYPTAFSSLAFPNPAATETTFELAVPLKSNFEIGLYDMNGKFIQSVYSGELERGTFRRQLELTNLTPGIYLVAIISKDYKETVRISKI